MRQVKQSFHTGAYAFYEKITGNSIAEPSTISLFSIDQPTPQTILRDRTHLQTIYYVRKLLKDLRAACNSPFWEKLPHKNRFFRRVTDLPLLFTFFSRYIQSRTCFGRCTQYLLIRATGSDYEVSYPWPISRTHFSSPNNVRATEDRLYIISYNMLVEKCAWVFKCLQFESDSSADLWTCYLVTIHMQIVQTGRAKRKRVFAYADSENADQPTHPRSLIRAFSVR